MPSHCGVLLRRAHRDVALTAKYAGCNVAQQGNSYILPLRVSGVAVKMVCPVACPLTVSCSPSAMVVNLGVSTAAVRLKVNGVWQPVYQASTCGFTLEVVGGGLTLTAPYASNCWQFEGAKMLLSVQYMDRELTLSCPAVQPPATTPLPAHTDPEASTDAHMTTLATTVAPASADQLPFYPWLRGLYYPYGYGMPWNFQNGHLGTPPVTQTTTTTSAAATTTPAATVAPTSAGQLPLYPWLSGVYNPYVYGMPWRFQYSQPGTPPVTQTTTTTPAATVAPASADQLPFYPWLSGMYYPSGYGMPWNFQYGHPATPPVTQTTTTTPAATVAPASADQPLLYPWLPGMYKPYVPMGSPGVPVSAPNSGVKRQMYQMPWMNAFPQVPGLKSNARLSSG
ncbi:calcium-binding protein P-like [Ictalurus furcatus]|uniref:calcium-binding protein P-like n=1 Tax=Ictalurus furcatus TaxID=66913 RepID=UPI00234FC2D4|nr:calcium-binding protein P-like [Ictalurus furcatus]